MTATEASGRIAVVVDERADAMLPFTLEVNQLRLAELIERITGLRNTQMPVRC